ncbi:MAG: 2-amino-4-hydroxy-6-hydroxymethyldihydropteridine diphosphokinase [Rickettsiales bacterium]
MPSELIFLGLGSNVGNRQDYLDRAVQQLSSHSELALSDIKRSGIYETPALLPENAPADWDTPFLNMVLSAATTALPETALKAAKKIEQDLGRKNRGRWGPREIDIDILALGKRIIDTKTLILPHPEMINRAFVMKPLAEIAPDWVHPQTGIAVREYISRLYKI